MKVTYHKSCYSESIHLVSDTKDLNIVSGMTSHANVEEHLPELKNLSIKILSDLEDSELTSFYKSSVSEDYEAPVPSIESMRQESINYIKNLNGDKSERYLFMFTADLIQCIPSVGEEKSYSCEGCGDTNYSHEILLY